MAGTAKEEAAELRAARKRIEELERTPASGAVALNGAPHVTTGPVGQDSRGFSLCKAIGYLTGKVLYEEAKEDVHALQQFRKALADTNNLPVGTGGSSLMLPLGTELLSNAVTENKDYKVFKSMWAAGQDRTDADESAWIARRIMKSATPGSPVFKTAQSYLIDSLGGTLVAPPVQGELIELVRPKECLMQAGATSVPLPPNGRMVFPRQTGPSTFYWTAESQAITESNVTTGQVAMQAKKGGVLLTLPNELLAYASQAADTLVRNDAAKSIALGVDYAGLYGTGGAAQPKGLTLYTGTNEVIAYHSATPAPKGVATNGNTLRPEDGYRMIGLLEDRNFEFGGWIFRPTMANNITGYRGDATIPGDAAGGFVQSLMRQLSDRVPTDKYCGYPVTKSAIVKNALTKGSGTGLTEVFGGQWEHLMVGMYGAVELATSTQAGNTFAQDQTQVRALIHTDIVPRYESAFVWYSFLLNQMN